MYQASLLLYFFLFTANTHKNTPSHTRARACNLSQQYDILLTRACGRVLVFACVCGCVFLCGAGGGGNMCRYVSVCVGMCPCLRVRVHITHDTSAMRVYTHVYMPHAGCACVCSMMM